MSFNVSMVSEDKNTRQTELGMKLAELVVLVRGGGQIASGVAQRLFRCHFRACLIEIENPQAIRREVSFCEAIHEGVRS